MRPIATLFKTINSYYLYDGIMASIIPINKDTYKLIGNVLRGNSDLNEAIDANNEIKELIERGYLKSKSPVIELMHPYTPYLNYFLTRKLSSITLQVTQDCNFRCKYCVYSETDNKKQRSHNKKHMSYQMGKDAIDFLWRYSVDSEDINVSFYGGEPLLEFKLIKDLVAYAKELFKGKVLTFSMTTNGTLLNEKTIDFLNENNFNLMISLDGPKEINDLNRVYPDGTGTYDSVMERIDYIFEKYPEYAKNISISMVMDPSNDFDCINNITLDAENIKEMRLSPTIVDFDYDTEIETVFSEDFVWKYEYNKFLAILSILGRVATNKTSKIALTAIRNGMDSFKNFYYSTPLRHIDCPSGPCIPGKMRLFVTVDGTFLPCERVSESSEAMQIGDIYSGFNLFKAQKVLNVSHLTKRECINCWAFRFCNQCAKKADVISSEFSKSEKLHNCFDTRNSVYYEMLNYIRYQDMFRYYSDQLEVTK